MSYKVECPICGKITEQVNYRYKYCSAECRKTGAKEIISRCHKAKYQYQPRPVFCKICGKPTESYVRDGRHCRRRMHEECILSDVIRTVSEHKRLTSCQKSRIEYLGYTVSDIHEEIEMREM